MPVIRRRALLSPSRLREEGGFTMVAVMGSMVAIMGFSAVAVAVATNDLEGNAYNKESRQALAAAEAGINDYLYHLNEDNTYWAKCTDVPEPSAVNQVGSLAKRRDVPGTNASYAIELLPANGATSCDTANAAATMLDTATGTFRIRSTGRVPTGAGSFAERQMVVTFKRRGFLEFLYFTDYETSDPAWYALQTGGLPTRTPDGAPSPYKDLVTWASENCQTYWKDGRGDKLYDGQRYYNDTWYDFNRACSSIQFAPGDAINGPLHTNDDLLVCGSPTFGRTSLDRIEVSGQTPGTPGWRPSCADASPNFVGTFLPSAPALTLPPSNTKLERIVESDYKFTGTTVIELNGANMTISNSTMGLDSVSRPLPPNGVIYVEDGACGEGYDPLSPYSAPEGCGDVYLRGSYSSDLTIAAEKDIIVYEDVTRADDSVLGLIANQFVRVYHPTYYWPTSSCTNASGGPGSIRIDAAILALQHSFTVDAYSCGDPLGTLTVNGVIAQKFRGPVGTGGGTVSTGYVKDYNYDDRLSLRQPPHFLDPVESAWRVQRQSEQTNP